MLDRLYLRVLGFAFQVLGDAELAARAAEAVFVRRPAPATELEVWAAAVDTIRSFLGRGFVVRPLVSLGQGWQADLLEGLALLSPWERALLLLRYHEGLEPATLAEVLKMTEAELRSQIAVARGQLIDMVQT